MSKFLKALRVAGDVAEIIVATQLFRQFEPKKEENLTLLENLSRTTITEQQFCQIIGRLRLYQALPTEQQRELPEVILGDQSINAATRNYTSNPNFGKREGEDIYRKSKEQKQEQYAGVIKLLKKGYSVRNIAKIEGVGISTVMRLKKEFCE